MKKEWDCKQNGAICLGAVLSVSESGRANSARAVFPLSRRFRQPAAAALPAL